MATILNEDTLTEVSSVKKKRTFQFKVDAPLNGEYRFTINRERVELIDNKLVNRELEQDNTPGNEFVPQISKRVIDVLAQPATDVISYTAVDGTTKEIEIRDITPMLISYFDAMASEAESALSS